MKFIIGLVLLFTTACGLSPRDTSRVGGNEVTTAVSGSISTTRHSKFDSSATYRVGVITKDFTGETSGSTATKPDVLNIPEKKRVYLYDQVSTTSVDAVLDALRKVLATENEAYLFIDSPGGSVFDGARLVSYIKDSPKPIHTVAVGMAASMGFQIFEVGATRLMTSNAFLMGHSASGGTQGTVHEMEALIVFIRKYTEAWDRAIAKRADIPYEKFEVMQLKNMWLPASEAMELHLADKIVHIP